MSQYNLLSSLGFFLCLIFNVSHQSQLFRDLSGATDQNFQAQVAQWTLIDPSGTQYSPTVSNCLIDYIAVKSSSLPIGTTLTKTFDGLEPHDVLRFFVRIKSLGKWKSQTVNIKFDDVSLETSEALFDIEDSETCYPDYDAGEINYFGTVEHNSSSVTVEFSTNLYDTNKEVSWGIHDFSLVTDFSESWETSIIYAQTNAADITIEDYICQDYQYRGIPYCTSCTQPCSVCYGPGSDQCFLYSSSSPKARLCPEFQTLTMSGCTNCLENCTSCDKDVNSCDSCFTTCAQCVPYSSPPKCLQCTLESNFVLYESSCLASCPDGYYADFERNCKACLSTGCPKCSGNMIAQDGICKCESPRILIGNNCECPAYLTEDTDTLTCEYIDLIDIAYQSTVSPLFDAILQVQINPLLKWTDPPTFTWKADCTYKNLDTKSLLQTYLSSQTTDVLEIPSSYLEYNFQCSIKASYFNEDNIEISKTITFTTLSSSQAQVQITGGPFQSLSHTSLSFIFAEVKLSTGKVLSTSDLKQIKWTQTSGDSLDMSKIFSSSNPFQLKISKCTLSQGKIYKFNKIFAKSNIAQIQNISVLGKFDFWKSVAFWNVIAFSAWFLVSFYWLYVKHPTYCVLKTNKNINKQSLFKRINFFFWVIFLKNFIFNFSQ